MVGAEQDKTKPSLKTKGSVEFGLLQTTFPRRKPEEHSLHKAILTALRSFEDAIQTDPDILGVFYYGSTGHGTSDQFSDLDISVWVVDAIEGAEAISAKIWAVAWLHWPGAFHLWTRSVGKGFVGDDWRRVDIDVERKADLTPDAHYAQAHIVKDTDGVWAQLIAASPKDIPAVTLAQAVEVIEEAIDTQFFVALQNARGAVWSAMDEVASHSKQLYGLLAQFRGHLSYGFRYVEQLLSVEEQEMLRACWPQQPQPAEVRRASRVLWAWTKHVWAEAERELGRSLHMAVDEREMLAAVERIYSWREETGEQGPFSGQAF
jgi:hypothetical protein